MALPILKLFLIFCLLQCSVSDKRVKFTGYETHRFSPETQEDLELLKFVHDKNPGVIFLRQPGNLNQPVDILFPPHLQSDLLSTLSNEMPSLLVSHDMESLINHEENVQQLEALGDDKFTFTAFWDHKKVNAFYDHLQTTHPNLCTVEEYGRSVENRPLRAVVVSSVHPVPADKPVMLIDAGTHAREWITVMSCAHYLNEIVSDKPEMVALREKFVFVFACLVNPDGYIYSFTVNRLWRKNRSDNDGHPLCKGVDPNRNYDFGFGGEGSSADKCSEIYHGTAPFSIPETKSLKELIMKKNVVSYISCHSYSQLVLLSYGCKEGAKTHQYPEFQDHLNIANQGLNVLKNVHGADYAAGNSDEILYEACGTSADWVKAHKATYAYTFELRDQGKFGFVLPASEIKPCAEELAGALTTMYQAMAVELFGKKD